MAPTKVRRALKSVFCVAAVASSMLAASGCRDDQPSGSYVARVGDAHLSEEDVVSALASVPVGLDSLHAADQIVERWVTDELLSQEARRRNIQDDSEVRKRLEANERSVLISSLIDRLYEEVDPPTEREIEAYFDRNVENLALREPFLRVRHLATGDSLVTVAALALLDTLDRAASPDSVWEAFLAAVDETGQAPALDPTTYYPASRLFRNSPFLQEAVGKLGNGRSTVLISPDSLYHVIAVADRVAAGTTPRVEWITDIIQNRLLIEKRKQMYVDQVQRLRNRALAEGRLEVRE
jgi:hypothetical protein